MKTQDTARPGHTWLLGAAAAQDAPQLASAALVLHDPELAPPRARRTLALPPDPAQRLVTLRQVLPEQVRAGEAVCLLLAGTPFVGGAGVAECELLAEYGLPFTVVPGAARPGCLAVYARVPLQFGDPAGAYAAGSAALPDGADTVVCFGPVPHLMQCARRLIRGGRGEQSPALLVSRLPAQGRSTHPLPLAAVAGGRLPAELAPPTALISGRVADPVWRRLNRRRSPLLGCSVLVTRSPAQTASLSRPLAELGGQVVEMPLIRIAPPPDPAPLAAALAALDTYDWVVFTSQNAVERCLAALPGPWPSGVQVAAVGAATARALAARAVTPDLVPAVFTGRAVAAALAERLQPGRRVLLPRADIADPALPRLLAKTGAWVDDVVAYATELDRSGAARLGRALLAGGLDYIVLTSPSTVKSLVAQVSRELLQGDVRLISIGPETSRALAAAGLRPAAEAEPSTAVGLVETVSRDARQQLAAD